LYRAQLRKIYSGTYAREGGLERILSSRASIASFCEADVVVGRFEEDEDPEEEVEADIMSRQSRDYSVPE